MVMTKKQEERQDHRINGKYAKVNPCYVCGKSAGIEYYAHKDTDGLINDELLCLCRRCYDKLEKYDGKTAVKIAFGVNSIENIEEIPIIDNDSPEELIKWGQQQRGI